MHKGTVSPQFMDWKERAKIQDEYQAKLFEILSELESKVGGNSVRNVLTSSLDVVMQKDSERHSEGFDRFNNENELKKWLWDHLHSDFHLYQEVPGTHKYSHKGVIVDFIAYPRQHLLDSGFINMPFGIEVKHIAQELGFIKKTSRALWQAASYNQCSFILKNKTKTRNFSLPFCLLFSNLSFGDEFNLIKEFDRNLVNEKSAWRGMVHLANHAGVGLLSITGSKHLCRNWYIKFASGTYFSGGFDNTGNRSYRMSDENLVTKQRVGNF